MSEVVLRRQVARRLSLTFVGGVVAISVYLVGTFVSYLILSGPFGPFTNWLSDLGNRDLNPSGALCYNIGVVLTGIGLLAFFAGLQRWSLQAGPRIRRRLEAVQVLGYIAALTTVATALIPESLNKDLHGIVSMTNIEFLAAAAALSGLFLLRVRGFWTPVAVVALASEVVAIGFGFLLHTFWMEWLAVGLVLLYVFLMALNDRRASIAIGQERFAA